MVKISPMDSSGSPIVAPDLVPRRVTDWFWIVAFGVIVVALIVVATIEREILMTLCSAPWLWFSHQWTAADMLLCVAGAFGAGLVSFVHLAVFAVNARYWVRGSFVFMILSMLLCAYGVFRLELLKSESSSQIGAIVFIVSALICICIAVVMREATEDAIDSASGSEQCIAMTPLSKLIPITHLGFSYVSSFLTVMIALILWAPGLSVRLQLFLIGSLVVMFWMQEVNFAIKEFVLVYTGVSWHSSHGQTDLNAVVCKAYFVAFRYHLGTLICGALILGVGRPLRWLLAAFLTHGDTLSNRGDDCGNAFGRAASCIRWFLGWTCEYAYIETAGSGKSFFDAAFATSNNIARGGDQWSAWSGSTRTLQIVGVANVLGLAMIACVGIVFELGMHGVAVTNIATMPSITEDLVARRLIAHTEMDAWDKSLYICGAIMLIAGVVAYSFLMVIGIVADTILYCDIVSTAAEKPYSTPTNVDAAWMGDKSETSSTSWKAGDGH